jgi:DNA transformation protein
MGELKKCINIGEVVEKQLNEVDIFTFEELKKTGSKEAWARIKLIDSSSCINKLMALEGAIRGTRWHYLEESVKKDLKDFYNNFK